MILFIQYLYLNLSGLQANNFVYVAYNIYIYLNVSSVKKENCIPSLRIQSFNTNIELVN